MVSVKTEESLEILIDDFEAQMENLSRESTPVVAEWKKILSQTEPVGDKRAESREIVGFYKELMPVMDFLLNYSYWTKYPGSIFEVYDDARREAILIKVLRLFAALPSSLRGKLPRDRGEFIINMIDELKKSNNPMVLEKTEEFLEILIDDFEAQMEDLRRGSTPVVDKRQLKELGISAEGAYRLKDILKILKNNSQADKLLTSKTPEPTLEISEPRISLAQQLEFSRDTRQPQILLPELTLINQAI
jgi:hypothetical protein